MSNPSKRKGSDWETRVARHLREHGYPSCERRALAGNADLGDIVNGPACLTIECKAAKRYDLPGWLKEAGQEAANVENRYGVGTYPAVFVKAHGKASAGDGFAVMRISDFVELVGRSDR